MIDEVNRLAMVYNKKRLHQYNNARVTQFQKNLNLCKFFLLRTEILKTLTFTIISFNFGCFLQSDLWLKHSSLHTFKYTLQLGSYLDQIIPPKYNLEPKERRVQSTRRSSEYKIVHFFVRQNAGLISMIIIMHFIRVTWLGYHAKSKKNNPWVQNS